MKRGFTLLEVVIVIAILGILVAMAVPKYVEFRKEALKRSEEYVRGTLKEAMAIYMSRNENTPYQGNPFDLLTQSPPFKVCATIDEMDGTEPDGHTWLVVIYDIYDDGSWWRAEVACPHWVLGERGTNYSFDTCVETKECNYWCQYDYGH